MKIYTNSISSKSVEIIIEDEDISLADIIHHELLSDNNVVFAGAVPTHPLLRKTVIRVETKSRNPTDATISSSSKALENIEKLLTMARGAIIKKK